ncbi:ABC-type multidrug transport system, ATPase and permease components [Alteracholeplasma palmae J233]|uniref:ABC-type multidrug transport system, ATPase and permease components n=1 Tax=Alteracholeplasma palmae (strain ATCC 49389 / J233) TaxID=1318466 RepID=U4KLB6_ALTPJ|nr:ABC transporter ATP-binding protein [Alteracholeplasma palmae]CCV64597.1 ABC-type multidrug transport system, ATPase and permease components [Alteracholeplasma palmae J233]
MFKLLKYLNTCKKEAILTPILVMLEVLSEVFIPIFMGKLIDEGIKGNDISLAYRYGIYMVALAILALIFGVLASRKAAIVANQLGRNIRKAEYEKIQTYAFENIDKFSTSSLVTRLTMDVSMVQNAVQMNIRIAFRAPAMILFSITSAYIVGGNLALIFVFIAPFVGLGLWIIMRGAHKYFVQMFNKVDKLNLKVQESLSGIRTVKSYVREDYEIEKFEEVIEDVATNGKKAEKWVMFNNPLMQLSICICFTLIAWFGSYNMVVNGLTEGAFANIISYVMHILMSLMMLSQVFLMIVISKASVERITEVLNETSSLTEKQDAVSEVKEGTFEFKDVSFRYKDKDILKNINFKAKQGEFIGIFGATGTGKTTMIQLISRLYDASSGTVLVSDIDVKDYKLEVLRKEVVTVLQKNVLFSGTIRDNIKWGKEDATDEEIISALKKAHAYEFVSKMKDFLDTWIEQGGVNVSGGQRQRLCIARALISNPKILIMDDSTSAVDTKTDSQIKETLREETPNMTKVIISQRLSSIKDADRIIILDTNGINGIGNHEYLYAHNEIYKDVYDLQQKGKGSEIDE